MIKIFGVRGSLIGDIIMSLPILDYLKEKYGNYYLYFAIAQKCQQAKA
jgi:ADP-heptose:LPS heptosyltransferase